MTWASMLSNQRASTARELQADAATPLRMDHACASINERCCQKSFLVMIIERARLATNSTADIRQNAACFTLMQVAPQRLLS